MLNAGTVARWFRVSGSDFGTSDRLWISGPGQKSQNALVSFSGGRFGRLHNLPHVLVDLWNGSLFAILNTTDCLRNEYRRRGLGVRRAFHSSRCRIFVSMVDVGKSARASSTYAISEDRRRRFKSDTRSFADFARDRVCEFEFSRVWSCCAADWTMLGFRFVPNCDSTQ